MIGALLAISITVIAGAAAWSFVRNQAGASELSLENGAVATNNFLNENFKVVDMYFPAVGSCPGSATAYCVTFWLYNTGSIPFQPVSVRFYDSAKLINILFNVSPCPTGTTKDCAWDLLSTLSTQCALAASSYESSTISTMVVKLTSMQYLTLTIPPAQGSCSSDPSYGQPLNSGTTYSIVVVGFYGNTVTYSQVHP